MELQFCVVFCALSGRFVGKRRARDVGGVENGRADERPAPRDARPCHDAIQTLSIVHSQHNSRDEMFGRCHVSILS